MSVSSFTDLVVGLGAGVAGVLLLVVGLPLCAAVFGRSFARAYRHRRFHGAWRGALVTSGVVITGFVLWNLAVASAPGVYSEPLMMLALTFLPFTSAFAVLALVVRRYAISAPEVVAATARRGTWH
jgi:hypothetical protein